MSLQDVRQLAIKKMEAEIENSQKELAKMRENHIKLQQEIFDLSKGSASIQLVRESEALKREQGQLVVSIRNLDAKISRLKNRVKRFKRNG